jgi:hypothetical protein
VIAPAVGGASPRALTFIASNFKCFQYLTFRRGMYWHELPEGVPLRELTQEPRFREVKAFVLGPEDLASPGAMGWLSWLEGNAIEKTAEVDARLGRRSGWRVFVGADLSAMDWGAAGRDGPWGRVGSQINLLLPGSVQPGGVLACFRDAMAKP